MRCIWSTSTGVLLRRTIFTSRKPDFYRIKPCTTIPRGFSHQITRLSASRNNLVHARTTDGRQPAPAIPDIISSLSPENALKEPVPEASPRTEHLTAAQLSRVAAQAVRMSIDSRELNNAYFIVNSLRLSVFADNRSIAKIPGFRTQVQRFDPIQFDKPVSPRLSAHALLHGLIRLGLSIKAYQQADLMLKQGMRVRSASLEAVTSALLASSSPITAASKPLPSNVKLNQADILNLRPNIVSDPCTRHAVRLFVRAREYRQRRSKNAYQSLINACLLQGEIIVGSLLFAMVVKDWQLRKTLSARFNSDREEPPTLAERTSPLEVDLRARLNHLRAENLAPQGETMLSILSSIDAVLSRDPQEPSEQIAFQASLQALANLAVLLDDRQIPFPQVAPLIRTLYSVPRVGNEVWIIRNGIPRRTKGYAYFHIVLERLIHSLPDKPPDKTLLPPLDLHAYNSLLNYALRHRCSPTLAEEIMEHMRRKRWKPLKPDMATYNIFLRSGTLIRRQDVTRQVLAEMRQNMVRVDAQSMAESGFEARLDTSQTRPIADVNSGPSTSLSLVGRENTGKTPHNSLKADPFTLSIYIAYLTSIGQPHIVAQILFRVLPELAIIDHPSWGSLSDEERQRLRALSRQICIQRAVAHGPYFFTSVLNALRKAGKTGLAERVWHLAKEAERVSWIPEFMPNSGPWCLPVHAYTIMIQCYAAEAQAGLRYRRALLRSSRVFSATEDQADWVPTSKQNVRGWAHFILSREQLTRFKINRMAAARQMGMILFHSMKSGARAVYQALLTIRHLDKGRWQNVQVPSPDARFFNAALALSAYNLRRPRRNKRISRTYWRRKLTRATSQYAHRGELPREWNPMLQDIAQEMINAGYSLPPALRYLFVGRWPSGTPRRNNPDPLDRQPFCYAPLRPNSSRLHHIRTVNSRGQLLTGRTRRGRRFTIVKSSDLSDVALAPNH